MQAMDTVVHPSVLPEPFGLTLVEAMLIGTPVVAADSGAVPETLDEGRPGMLVTPGDPQALAAAPGELMRNRTLHGQMVQAAALARYGVEAMATEIKRVLATLADGVDDRRPT